MNKRVSATTITDITASLDKSRKTPPAPPTAEELIVQIRRELKDNVEKFNRQAGLSGAFNRASSDPEKQLADFEKILKTVPDGFKLVPVLYTKIEREKNEAVYDEYSSKVRSRFLSFIAENYADELKNMGICDHGIARMKNGVDPADASGRFYNISIDHIVERSGSGIWADMHEPDPDREGTGKRFPPNHFGNLILLSDAVHQYKNALNALQNAATQKPGESKWILMMTPERDAAHAGFVCQPQSNAAYKLAYRPDDPFQLINHASFTVKMATEALRDLSNIFSNAANDNRAPKKSVDLILKPAVGEAARCLTETFERYHKGATDRDRRAYDDFLQFYAGKNVRALRENVVTFDFQEAAALKKAFAGIDQKIAQRKASGGGSPPALEKQPCPSKVRHNRHDRKRRHH